MKELSIEQKAKRYDEAIERAKEWYNNPNSSSIGKSYLYAVFPELKDSEDERIRKEIIETFKILGDGKIPVDINYADIFTWLEKQGEQPKEATYTNEVETGNGNIKAMVTEKVQLPKFKVKYAGNEYNVLEIKESAEATFYGIEDEPNHIDYVKAENCEIISGYAIKENGSPYPTKPAVFSEQKPQRMVSAEAKEAMYDKPTDNDMVEALRTEYEKGRADVLRCIDPDVMVADFCSQPFSKTRSLASIYRQGITDIIKRIKSNEETSITGTCRYHDAWV